MRKLICHLREARRRAPEAAREELLSVLYGLGAEASVSGPLAGQAGVLWVDVPAAAVDEAAARLPRLGYTTAVDVAEEVPPKAGGPTVRYRRRDWRLQRLYEEDATRLRAEAPDRRKFLLTRTDGSIHVAHGYRGTGEPGKRRALPACDARLLANLVAPAVGAGGRLLDPFAGAGSIVQHAVACGMTVLSADIDAPLAAGLRGLGSRHHVADARCLPLADGSICGIATEPPYDPEFGSVVADTMQELARVLGDGGRIAMLCARWQRDGLTRAAAHLDLTTLLAVNIDRKGSDCSLLLWRRER